MKNRVNERLRMIIGSLVSLAGLGDIMGILVMVIAVREYKWSRKYGRVDVHGAMWVKSMSSSIALLVGTSLHPLLPLLAFGVYASFANAVLDTA